MWLPFVTQGVAFCNLKISEEHHMPRSSMDNVDKKLVSILMENGMWRKEENPAMSGLAGM